MKQLLKVKGERFEFETNMLLETKTKKIPIVEVPIRTIYLEENKTSHFNPVRDSVKIYLIFGKFLFLPCPQAWWIWHCLLCSAFC